MKTTTLLSNGTFENLPLQIRFKTLLRISLSALFFLFVLTAEAGRVTKVEAITIKQTVVNGCDDSKKVITFNALITANGPCIVTYRWFRNDGGVGAIQKLSFITAGTQIVSTTWSLWLPSYEGWEAVEIIEPEKMVSNKAHFSITCCKKENEYNCTSNPFNISPCALDMINTFKKLVTDVDTRICNTTAGSINVSSAMSGSCYPSRYSGQNYSGPLTYTSFYIPADSTFRVIWGSAAYDNLAYNYYGACSPKPIIFPEGVGENHVYETFLIPIETYKISVDKSYPALVRSAIPPRIIADLEGWYYESASGYIATTENANYINIYSSKGLVVKVKTDSGMSIMCYLINNYDHAETMIWKDRNMCPTASEPSNAKNLIPEKVSDGDDQKNIISDEEPILYQNNPNPFSTDTEIKMTIPKNAKQVLLLVNSVEGKKLKSIQVSERGKGSIKISGNELQPGMYFYTLIVDDEVINTKSMILTK